MGVEPIQGFRPAGLANLSRDRLSHPPVDLLYHLKTFFCYTGFVSLLDFLFPKYCVSCKKIGSYLCSDCFSYLSFDTYGVCLCCGKPSINNLTHPACRSRYVINGEFTALKYKGVARKLIYNFKYKPYLSDLQTVLGDLFYESLIQQEGFESINKSAFVLVPIPLHVKKLKRRGYNHARILAEELGKRLGLLVIDALFRVKDTPSQVGLDRKKRRENIASAFAVSKRCDLKKGRTFISNNGVFNNCSIFLVDDILTTGSTLLEAAKTLKKAGAKKVLGLALAQD